MIKHPLTTKVISIKSLKSSQLQNPNYVWIADEIFKDVFQSAPNAKVYFVRSGESLKDVADFPAHILELHHLSEGISPKDLTFVSLGGGSVGDFAGFIASIYKRGVSLIHVPTTWLSAMDSAHGGKTALNLAKAKNQIGTFYSAKQVWLVEKFLLQQPEVRLQEAWGEVFKTALLDNTVWKKVGALKKYDSKSLFLILKDLIAAKMKIVRKDPFEESGYRHLLNLGHTVGHVLESDLGFAHGEAVRLGIEFALELSLKEKILSPKDYEKIHTYKHRNPDSRAHLYRALRQVKSFESLLKKDKKQTAANKVRFVFVKKPGRCVVKEISFEKIFECYRGLIA
jgi:3-dehydroquinate synthase